MLSFDDISAIHDAIQERDNTSIVNERLADLQVERSQNNEPIQNVVGFNDNLLDELQQQTSVSELTAAQSDAMLKSINANLSAMLDTQNAQLAAFRDLKATSVEQIDAINNTITNNQANSTSNASSVTQNSNFTNELQTLLTTINTQNQNINSTNNVTQNNSSAQNQANLNVVRNFESTTNAAGELGRREVFTQANPFSLEMASQFDTFTTNNNNSTSVNSTNNKSATAATTSTSQSFSVNNNALNNTVQEIRAGDMSIDRTEIDNRVNQTSNTSNSETSVQNANVINAFSTALAKHDQTLVQAINQMTTNVTTKTENQTQTLAANFETQTKPNVQNNAPSAGNSNEEVVSLLTQISMQLMQLNAAMSRKTPFA
jgi:hypothetical protein